MHRTYIDIYLRNNIGNKDESMPYSILHTDGWFDTYNMNITMEERERIAAS